MRIKLEVEIEIGEMDVFELAKAVAMELRAMDIPNVDGGVMFIEQVGVVIRDVERNG